MKEDPKYHKSENDELFHEILGTIQPKLGKRTES